MLAVGTAVSAQSTLQTGQAYELVRVSETATRSGDGTSSSSSSDRDAIVERVIRIRDDGIELDYDLPDGATREDRDRQWQFPVRVFKPRDGATRLLDAAALEKRRDDWLAAAKLTRALCGRWFFTWNAFRIECDPASVLKTIAAFDPGPDGLRAGSAYRDPAALAPVPLVSVKAALTARMTVDPEQVRRDLAEVDVVTGEISGQQVTLAAARRLHAADTISGTIVTTLDIDAQGRVARRITIRTIEIKQKDGRSETRRQTETLLRRSVTAGVRAEPMI